MKARAPKKCRLREGWPNVYISNDLLQDAPSQLVWRTLVEGKEVQIAGGIAERLYIERSITGCAKPVSLAHLGRGNMAEDIAVPVNALMLPEHEFRVSSNAVHRGHAVKRMSVVTKSFAP